MTGLAVDPKGKPVAGAEVWAVAFREKAGATRTDARGRFRLEGLKDGKPLVVWAEAEGLARERRDGIHVFEGRDHDLGAIPLLPGTRMRDRVVDAEGRPIAGAEVGVKDFRHVLGHTISGDQTEWSLITREAGRIVTPPLPAGRVDFRIGSPGKVWTFAGRKAEPGTPEADLGDVTLADEVPLRGSIVDCEGRSAPGVEVIPDYDDEDTARAARDGRFAVRRVGKGVKILRLQSNDYFAPKPFDLGKIAAKRNLADVVVKLTGEKGAKAEEQTTRLDGVVTRDGRPSCPP